MSFPVNKEIATNFLDDSGDLQRQIVTGRLVVHLTNLETGATIVENISGPTTYTFESSDGFSGPYHW